VEANAPVASGACGYLDDCLVNKLHASPQKGKGQA
jgi:hypothetical protein